MKEQGILYGIGVGPGDPELLTLKAVEILKDVSVIFAAGSTRNDYSVAHDIVKKHLAPGTEIIKLGFPMTESQSELENAWSGNAEQVLDVLNSGRSAAFITLGDPLTYSTFAYLLRTVQSKDPKVRIVTIPGITSFQAAAARINMPLVEGRESLTILPGTLARDRIEAINKTTENIVILKTYRNYDDIYKALKNADLHKKAVLISKCGHEDETIERGLVEGRESKPPYLSLLLVKKNS